jgi:DNA-directed RNA polymerase specialized sigma subunit
MSDKIRILKKTMYELSSQLGREPSDAELAQKMGFSKETIRQI